jgi:DNA-binding transcriptional ArsR family regulator
MSLGVEPEPDPIAGLRAVAHPVRLRMLSLLTGAAMTAAELARELEITHANASYHVRQLLAAGQIALVGQERIHGGAAKRYRYLLDRKPTPEGPEKSQALRLVYAAVAVELQRRAALSAPVPATFTDAELWVEPAAWEAVKEKVEAASDELHRAAQPPRTPGTIRVNATMALFQMESDG